MTIEIGGTCSDCQFWQQPWGRYERVPGISIGWCVRTVPYLNNGTITHGRHTEQIPTISKARNSGMQTETDEDFGCTQWEKVRL